MRKESDEAFWNALLARATPKVKKRREQQAATGAWLTTIPDRFGGTKLSKSKWHDNVSIHYGWLPDTLPDCCDGCGEDLTVEHGLSCKKDDLVSIRHDDVRDKWAHLSPALEPPSSPPSSMAATGASIPPKAPPNLATNHVETSLPMDSGNVPAGLYSTSV
ncbi:hypothetical protein ACHAW6_001170, partial [Cyclotella cf. meneghiniana]